MVIKDLTLVELDDFYEVFAELMEEGYGQFPVELREHFLKKDYLKQNFESWLLRNIRKIFIAIEENGNIIGFLIADHTYGGVGFISWLGVLPEYRKQGIASQMLTMYEMYVISRKAHLIELYTYDAIADFYAKRGFQEIGRREHGFYGQMNIIMNKKLGNWDANQLVK